MAKSPVKIGVTLGDPSGVGPELVAALIAERGEEALDRALFFVDRLVLERSFTQRTGGRLPDSPSIIDRGLLSPDQAVPGRPSEAGAKAQVGYLEAAANYAKRGVIQAVVTGPVSKTQCRRAGIEFPGQTEFFAQRLGAQRCAMMFKSPRVSVILATTHIPIAKISETLTAERLDEVIDLGVDTVTRDLGVAGPRIGVVGLNPHAGEDGLLGHEEATTIVPALERASKRWPEASFEGPLVPDHAFREPSLQRFDLLVAMYHDQALIPLKLLDFDHTVNVTVGLPIVRTSPDHGVAYDIAGTGTARPDSFFTAFDLAIEMAERRGKLAAS